jgi:hypothetical protein
MRDHRLRRTARRDSLEEGQQFRVNLLLQCRAHAVRPAWDNLECRLLHELRGDERGIRDRNDLVVVAMKDEGWYVDFFQVFSEIRFRVTLL